MSEQQNKKAHFKLINQIYGVPDMGKLAAELEEIDNFLYQANLRKPGTSLAPPRTTKILERLFELNKQSILDEKQRKNMLNILHKLHDHAPTVHISFAVEPSPVFMEKIVTWFRLNIHPYLMVNTGLQPSVVVGCTLRTSNKIFDMSLRNRFLMSKQILMKKMEETGG
jgi:hypothetical protein